MSEEDMRKEIERLTLENERLRKECEFLSIYAIEVKRGTRIPGDFRKPRKRKQTPKQFKGGKHGKNRKEKF